MAPLPANQTPRLFVDYISGNLPTSIEHTMSFRAGVGGTPIDLDALQGKVTSFLLGIGAANLRNGWRVIRVRFQNGGEDFSVPYPLISSLEGFSGSSSVSLTQDREAIEWSFVGRSFVSGRRVKVSVYGLTVGIPPTFRLTAGAVPWVNAAVAALNEPTEPRLRAIDGTPVNFYPYVNVQYNSYWETRIRTG